MSANPPAPEGRLADLDDATLAEMERLARAVTESDQPHYASAQAAFERACTPERVTQLVLAARAGAEDTARLNWLNDTQRTDVRGSDGWKLIGYAWGTYGGLVPLREAIDEQRTAYAAAWKRAEERYPDRSPPAGTPHTNAPCPGCGYTMRHALRQTCCGCGHQFDDAPSPEGGAADA